MHEGNCTICELPLDGAFGGTIVSAGNGDGRSFAHRVCYDLRHCAGAGTSVSKAVGYAIEEAKRQMRFALSAHAADKALENRVWALEKRTDAVSQGEVAAIEARLAKQADTIHGARIRQEVALENRVAELEKKESNRATMTWPVCGAPAR